MKKKVTEPESSLDVIPKKGTKRKSQPEVSPPAGEEIEEVVVVKKLKTAATIETKQNRPVPRPVPRPVFKGAQKLKNHGLTSSSTASTHAASTSIEESGLHKRPSDAGVDDDIEPADSDPNTPARQLKKARVSGVRDNEVKNKPNPLRRTGMATPTSKHDD